MSSVWQRWRDKTPQSEREYQQQIDPLRAAAPVPVLWLFGKTGSGKSSVIHFLTGAEQATIGEGFRPETKASRRFDFPDSTDPLMTFLDTRGLGEAAYDPIEDIAAYSQTTQLMIVTVRVSDHALVDVLEPLRRIRRATPQRPVLLVLTCLHEATGAIDLSEGIDPFDAPPASEDPAAAEPLPPIPAELQTLIDRKSEQFAGLYDHLVPVDLTRLEDGFADPEFGGRRLRQAILQYLPHAYRQSMLSLASDAQQHRSKRQRRARWQILASSSLAATAGAVPVPWVDIPVVLAIQSHLAIRLGKIYEQELTASHWAALSSAAGSRIATRMALREVLKLIPWVGMAAGAASAFAFTYALGMSWDWYFASLHQGRAPSVDKLREIFADELQRGHELWKAE
ncbi:GTPase family protein [Rosistilla oblonga]|uniref:GTPase family protein n=1 Tax=Rosistilla oblonga TaxID=2527990 RepID=UPI003A97FB39